MLLSEEELLRLLVIVGVLPMVEHMRRESAILSPGLRKMKVVRFLA